VNKKKKIILIGVAVTLALVLGVGGLASAKLLHMETGGHKLIGVGEMGYDEYSGDYGWAQYQEWDTTFIITNPNCDKYLDIEWVALIDSAEKVIWEGPSGGPIPSELSPHEVAQVSLSELLVHDPDELDLDKYTLEITWSGASWSWWSGWGKARPLTGWQKEKCWFMFDKSVWGEDYPSFAISEAEMQLFPSRVHFRLPVD
jgi:hypothetical protein